MIEYSSTGYIATLGNINHGAVIDLESLNIGYTPGRSWIQRYLRRLHWVPTKVSRMTQSVAKPGESPTILMFLNQPGRCELLVSDVTCASPRTQEIPTPCILEEHGDYKGDDRARASGVSVQPGQGTNEQ